MVLFQTVDFETKSPPVGFEINNGFFRIRNLLCSQVTKIGRRENSLTRLSTLVVQVHCCLSHNHRNRCVHVEGKIGAVNTSALLFSSTQEGVPCPSDEQQCHSPLLLLQEGALNSMCQQHPIKTVGTFAHLHTIDIFMHKTQLTIRSSSNQLFFLTVCKNQMDSTYFKITVAKINIDIAKNLNITLASKYDR